MTTQELPVLSVILPCFNEAENVPYMAERVTKALEAAGDAFEVLWVDDGSTDGAGEILDALAAADGRHRILHLSRNFGHMAALTAGLKAARCSGAAISMDCDGQHPPEMLPELVRLWRGGADIVQTVRRPSATHETAFKRGTSGLFYALLKRLGDVDLPQGAADFRLLDRQVLDVLNGLPERDRFVRALVSWVGFQRVLLPYEAPPRRAGTSKYTFRKMVRLALSGITSFSTRPLRLSILLGVLVSGLAGVYALYVFWCYLRGEILTPGWTSMLLTILILSGMQLLALGIVSEYLARLYIEQKQRPVYIVKVRERPKDKAP